MTSWVSSKTKSGAQLYKTPSFKRYPRSVQYLSSGCFSWNSKASLIFFKTSAYRCFSRIFIANLLDISMGMGRRIPNYWSLGVTTCRQRHSFYEDCIQSSGCKIEFVKPVRPISLLLILKSSTISMLVIWSNPHVLLCIHEICFRPNYCHCFMFCCRIISSSIIQ